MQYISEIVSFIIGAFSGSLLTFTFTKKIASRSGTLIDQSRSSSGGGDIVAGNKTERK